MRGLLSGLLCVCLVSVAATQEKKAGPPPVRFGIAPDLETYPQGTAKQTLLSIAKALDRKRVEYVLAHLTDPSFVDEKVDSVGGKFDVLVQQTADHLNEDPKKTQLFRKFLTQGEVTESGTTAKVTHKDAPGRQVTLRQIEGRWFIQNEDTPEKK
ncbi:MAG: hypothetical protein ACJ8F7_05585 [Gemmataceae bacterium]